MKKTKIGLIGCGAIGKEVALFIDKKLPEAAFLYALADKNIDAAKRLRKKIKTLPKICSITDLIKKVDLVIETASIEAAEIALKKAVISRKDIVILSTGALIKNIAVLREARRKKINVYVPSGAVCGIDALGALSLGSIKKISLITSKPPEGLAGADYLRKEKINLTNLKKAKVVFRGSVKKAVKFFPRNINVAATLLLASHFANVKVCIKADPALKRNVHTVIVDAKEARISINVENIPSKSNPKTSTLAILSIQKLIAKLFSSFKIGS